MKNFYAFLMVISAIFAVNAQTADYELLGFADENGNPISSIVMNSTQDLQPRVILKNNGPGVVALTDTVFFNIFYNQTYYVTSLVLVGSQLQQLTAGEQAIVDLSSPIWTASTMDQYSLIACSICYELEIEGVVTDPNPSNNRACINVTRELDIDEVEGQPLSIFPNPASSSVTLRGTEGFNIQLFDLSGRMILSVEKATDNQLLDVSMLAEGLYIIRVSNGESVATRKLNVVR